MIVVPPEDRHRNLLDDLETALGRGKVLVSSPGAVVECHRLNVDPWPLVACAARRALVAEAENAEWLRLCRTFFVADTKEDVASAVGALREQANRSGWPDVSVPAFLRTLARAEALEAENVRLREDVARLLDLYGVPQ